MDQVGQTKADQQDDVEFDRLLGFEHLGNTAPEDAEAAVGIAHTKRLVIEGPPVSDRRLKRDIMLVGTAENGIALYDFRYLFSEATFRGVMAQDLLSDERYAGAVETRGGYLCVDYAKLGLQHLVTAEMRETGAQTHAAASMV